MSAPNPADLEIARATADQAAAVCALRDDAARWMLERGIRQWRPGDLPREWIELCIELGFVYAVSHDGRLIGSVAVVWDDPLVWGAQPEPAGYVHMLVVARERAGHGIGRSILTWAEQLIVEAGRSIARLDCVAGNDPLRSYYERAGYHFVRSRTFPEIKGAGATALYEKRLAPAP